VFTFDPDRVAELETAGWRAYYQRRWGRLLRVVVTLSQEQFQIPFPMSLVAAYYATRASLAWAPLDHDLRAVEAYYVRFYRLARRYGGLRFDPERVAALELEYNVVHRELVGRSNKVRFADTMTRLHSGVFGLSPEQAGESAEQRVLANTIVDRITNGQSTDTAGDWRLIEAALTKCYRSIQAQLTRETTPEHASLGRQSYAFTSIWQIDAPIQAVWDAIYHAERWPSWWPYIAAVDEVVPGDSSGVGAVRRYTWTTQLLYRLVFESRVTRVDAPRILEASVDGQLMGSGRWSLTPTECGTLVRYDWDVHTRLAWMNVLAPIARPFFAWNHGAVMRAGGRGLGRLLEARVQAGSLEEVQR
jgi:uncharacterized protein YndB with AHSA1/START domain